MPLSPEYAYLARLRDLLAQQLRGLPGIRGFGVGAPGKPVGLRVYVEDLSGPVLNAIPALFEGVPVLRVQSGVLTAQGVPGGSSVGHYRITAGTLGGLVRDASTGEPLFLSNAHVFAPMRQSTPGDRILHPGPYDGGTNSVARLVRWGELSSVESGRANLADCAVARPVSADVMDPTVRGVNALIEGVTSPENVSLVMKSGRSTGVKTGTIQDVDATVVVDYEEGVRCEFANVIITSVMSQGGDSGSLLLSQDGRFVVGLLFAGSPRLTLYNSIENVAQVLNIRVPNWNVEWAEVQGRAPTDSDGGGGVDANAPASSGSSSPSGVAQAGGGGVLPFLVVAAGVAVLAYALTRRNGSEGA